MRMTAALQRHTAVYRLKSNRVQFILSCRGSWAWPTKTNNFSLCAKRQQKSTLYLTVVNASRTLFVPRKSGAFHIKSDSEYRTGTILASGDDTPVESLPADTPCRHNEAARARWIAKNEVGLSRNLVAAGRSFSALLASHIRVDGARLKTDESCNLRNPTFYHNYFGTYPNPYEVIFFKCGGDISRAHAMPDHAVSSLQLYTEAIAKTWTHSVARERFITRRGLTQAPCPAPVPERNAFCMDTLWVIRGDWHISDHSTVRSKVRVLGSLKLVLYSSRYAPHC